MCLAVPGEVISIDGEDLNRMGCISFSGVFKDVSLAYVPDVKIGDYVVVHVGFAISILDVQEAERTLHDMQEIKGDSL